jgi:hypothetical protein
MKDLTKRNHLKKIKLEGESFRQPLPDDQENDIKKDEASMDID